MKAKKGAVTNKTDAKSAVKPTTAASPAAANANKSNVKQFWVARQHFDPSVSLVPEAVEQCLLYLRCHNAVAEEGIFRLSGTMELVELITQRFLAGEPLLLTTTKGVDIHVVAGVLKRWFRELPEPITTFELFDAFIAATELVLAKKGSVESIDVLRRALSVLPPGCSVTLRALLSLLYEVSQNSARNKMTPSNLSIVFAPSLLRANSDDPLVQMMGMQRATQFVELLIVNWPALDDTPPDEDDDADEDTDGDKRIADASSADDEAAAAVAEEDEDDVVHDASEAVTIVSAPSVHQVQVASAPVVHHAAIEHLPTMKHAVPIERGLSVEPSEAAKKRDKSPRPSSIAPRPPKKAPEPPRLVRMPSDRIERLREKSTALKASIETKADSNDDKLVRKLDGKAEKAAASPTLAPASGDEMTLTELELHRWESVLVVCESDGKAPALPSAAAAAPPAPAAVEEEQPAPPTNGNDSDSDSDSDDGDMMAPPLPPVLNATSEKSLAVAFETLVDIASVRLANRAIAARRELGAIAKSDNATMLQIAEADPYHQSFERKLAERFPAANAKHVKLALRLSNGDYEAAAKTLEEQGYGQPPPAAEAEAADSAPATDASAAVAARATAGSEAKRPSQSRIAARERVGAMKRGKDGKAAPPAILVRGASRSLASGANDAADASTPPTERAARPTASAAATAAAAQPADAELVKLAQLIDSISKADIDLQVWVDREAHANPKGGDVMTMKIEQDGAWSGLPGDVAKSVRLVETLFAKYGRNIDNFMDALYSVPELQSRDREQVFDQIGLLLTLAERNAERRMMQVQTMIRAKQHELKMQDLWIFSGDRSKRIKAALQKRRDSGQPTGERRTASDEHMPPEKHISNRASESKE